MNVTEQREGDSQVEGGMEGGEGSRKRRGVGGGRRGGLAGHQEKEALWLHSFSSYPRAWHTQSTVTAFPLDVIKEHTYEGQSIKSRFYFSGLKQIFT